MIRDVYTAYLAGNNWLSDYRVSAILAAIFIVYICVMKVVRYAGVDSRRMLLDNQVHQQITSYFNATFSH